MTLQDLKCKVREEFDKRNLKSNTRYRALEKVILYIKECHKGNIAVLQMPKIQFKIQYEKYKVDNGLAFSSAENSAINEIYNQFSISGNLQCNATSNPNDESARFLTDNGYETLMDYQYFEQISNLSESHIPEAPGLYAIRIKDITAIPHPFNEELKKRGHDLLYIGKASKNLRVRLWHQELNHKSPATFFRSIGAILGFRPTKGSLSGKNTRNYKFTLEDTQNIRCWIKENLLVNIQIQQDNIEDTETALIQKYRPIINISKNPAKLFIMSELRDECVRIAKEK